MKNINTKENNTLLVVSYNDLKELFGELTKASEHKANELVDEAKKKELMTRKEVMNLLNVSEATLWRWKDEILTPRKIGRRVLYVRSEVEALVA